MNTITTPDFMSKIARIRAEVRNRTCTDDVDAEVLEVIEKILQGELNEYCTLLNEYYKEEYYNALASARSKAYDDGHSDGYDDGYESGYADCHAKNHYAV